MTPQEGESGVVAEAVGFVYQNPAGPVIALRHADLRLAPGVSTAVVGRSGSGKSTLVSILALLRRPSTGVVRFWGMDTAELGDRDLAELRGASIGVVFQSFHLDPSATALENVMLPWYFQPRIPRAEAHRRAQRALECMGVPELRHRRPGEMSGGQRQRVAIARALLFEPRLLIADEPTGNLDEETASGIADHLFGLAREFSSAVVLVTHDRELANRADRIVTIASGRLGPELAP